MTQCLMTNDWIAQWQQLTVLLKSTSQYWQVLPFEHCQFPWLDNAELTNALSVLSEQEVWRLDGDDQQLRQFISPLIGIQLDIIDDLPVKSAPISATTSHFKAGIKGRKWAQIERFESLLAQDNIPIVEWCAGKGHLGRLISLHRQLAVTSLEYQTQLCEQGQSLAMKHGVLQSFKHADVLTPQVRSYLSAQQHGVALHACGDLHGALLTQGVAVDMAKFSIAPCCYHLIQGTTYQPLSRLARASELTLSRQALSLSMQQTVVATKRERHHRTVEVAWRLGFDLLQRQLTERDTYLPLPTVKQSLLTSSFESFGRWACEIKGIAITRDIDWNAFEQMGYMRQQQNKKIELVTHAFRQIIERWLLLDRVIYLIEHGYDVELFNFCDRSMTPRNAMIQASKPLS